MDWATPLMVVSYYSIDLYSAKSVAKPEVICALTGSQRSNLIAGAGESSFCWAYVWCCFEYPPKCGHLRPELPCEASVSSGLKRPAWRADS